MQLRHESYPLTRIIATNPLPLPKNDKGRKGVGAHPIIESEKQQWQQGKAHSLTFNTTRQKRGLVSLEHGGRDWIKANAQYLWAMLDTVTDLLQSSQHAGQRLSSWLHNTPVAATWCTPGLLVQKSG